MKKRRPPPPPPPNEIKAYCSFCGSTVGHVSDRTGEKVSAVYDCPRCRRNYCDQCSYEQTTDGKRVQRCLRCDAQLEQVM